MRRTCTVLCLVVLCLATSTSLIADDCAKVVAAAQTKIKIKKNKSHSENIYDFACSKEFETMVSSSSSGFSIKIPIEGVVLDFGGNQSNSSNMTRLKTFCRQRSYQLNDDEASYVYQQFLPDATRLKALGELGVCRSAGGGRLVEVDIDPIDLASATVHVRFNRPPLPDTVKIPNPVLFELKMTNMTCPGTTLKPLAPVPQAGLSEVCSRVAKKDATVTVLHNSGAPVTETLPWDLHNQPAGAVILTVQLESVGQWKFEADLRETKVMRLHGMFGFFDWWFEDGVVFKMPDGKITDLEASCKELCNHGNPHVEAMHERNKTKPWQILWKTPVETGEFREAGVGFKHERYTAAPPTWEVTAKWWRKTPADRFLPDASQDVLYDKAFSIVIPKNRVAARLKFDFAGTSQVINVGDTHEMLELIATTESGNDQIYTYIPRVPRAFQ